MTLGDYTDFRAQALEDLNQHFRHKIEIERMKMRIQWEVMAQRSWDELVQVIKENDLHSIYVEQSGPATATAYHGFKPYVVFTKSFEQVLFKIAALGCRPIVRVRKDEHT